jgi:hypothetical protein
MDSSNHMTERALPPAEPHSPADPDSAGGTVSFDEQAPDPEVGELIESLGVLDPADAVEPAAHIAELLGRALEKEEG